MVVRTALAKCAFDALVSMGFKDWGASGLGEAGVLEEGGWVAMYLQAP